MVEEVRILFDYGGVQITNYFIIQMKCVDWKVFYVVFGFVDVCSRPYVIHLDETKNKAALEPAYSAISEL